MWKNIKDLILKEIESFKHRYKEVDQIELINEEIVDIENSLNDMELISSKMRAVAKISALRDEIVCIKKEQEKK